MGRITYDLYALSKGWSPMTLSSSWSWFTSWFISTGAVSDKIAEPILDFDNIIYKKKDLYNIEGQRAFETFLEQLWYTINQDHQDASQCIVYNNQTEQL